MESPPVWFVVSSAHVLPDILQWLTFHSGGEFLLSADFDGGDFETALKGRADFLGIKKCEVPDFMDRHPSVRLPLAKGPEGGAGGFAGEIDLDAIRCANELFMISHEHEDAMTCCI